MKWGELITLEYGKPVPDKACVNGAVPVYGTNGKIGTSNLPPLCGHPSFILGRKGAYRGVHYSDVPFSVIDTAFYAEPVSDKLDLKWAYYKFLTYDINRMDSGSAIPSTDRYEIYNIPVNLPPLETQKKTVRLLDSIEAKIRCNQQINGNLQQQADAIFKACFVNYTLSFGQKPSHWKQGVLKDILYFKRNPVTAVNKDMSLPYLPIDSIPMNTFAISEVRPNSEAKSSLITFRKDDIMIGAMRVYFHRVVPAPFDGITRTTCFTLVPYDPDYFCFALLLCDQESSIQYAQRTSKGSTMPYAVWDNGLGDMPIEIPPKDIVMEFHNMVSPMVRKIQSSFFENKHLKEIRDTLLPRLMSGELDVSALNL